MLLAPLLLKLISGEPLTKAEGYQIALLVLRLLRKTGGATS